uniref:Glycosyltransferase n=1 Tax=viral metagenome TaxID=1070528 RepID=A0A6C0LDA4_9ZZZZ
MNTNCYRLEKLDYADGLLDIDATYIIHLEGNGRIDHIHEQLTKYHPSNTVYILYNKGFKQCEKKLHMDDSKIDLIDAFLSIFKDAQQKNYGTILILEDDFIFHEKIKDIQVRKNVMSFLKKKENEPMIYMLGCLPFIQQPYDYYNNILLMGIGCHACIYTRNIREKILQKDQTKIIDWDYYTLFEEKRYLYHEPLCYQLFPETENQKNWFSFLGLKNILIYLFQTLKLDEQVEPGYSIFYMASKLLFVLLILLLILLIIATSVWIMRYHKKSKLFTNVKIRK